MDSVGFYWYGCRSGILRYDGESTKHYTIKAKNDSVEHDQYVVSEGFLDRHDNMWFSTYMGIHSFNLISEKFESYQIKHAGAILRDGYSIYHIDAPREELVLRAGSSLWALSVTSHEYRLLKDFTTIHSVSTLPDSSGLRFFGAPWEYDPTGFEYFDYREGAIVNSKRIPSKDKVKSLVAYTLDSIFTCTPGGIDLILDPLDEKHRRTERIVSGTCRNIAMSPDRKTIYGSILDNGLYSLVPGLELAVSLTDSSDLLSSNRVNNIRCDPNGTVFLSHEAATSDILYRGSSKMFFDPVTPGQVVRDIIQTPEGRLLISEKGMLMHSKGEGSPWERISIVENQDSVLAYPLLFQSSTGKTYATGLKGVAAITPKGEISRMKKYNYSVYRGGISINSKEVILLRQRKALLLDQELNPKVIASLIMPSDGYFSSIEFISPNRFLLCYKESELWDMSKENESWQIRAKYLLPGEMRDVVIKNETIYIASTAGLLALKSDSIQTVFNASNSNEGLWINSLHQDEKENIWLGTPGGLFCYNPLENNYLFFSKADGIPDDWFIRANVIATDSTFTMATKTGLVTVNTTLADDLISDNKIYLSDIWVNGIRDTEHSLYDPQPLDLDYQHNALAFQPGMIELAPSALSGFRHRLVGLEHDYTYSKAGEQIRYPSIPPGSYTFEFVGVDKNGRQTEPFTLPVSISPPFYQTWWFWLLIASGTLGTGYYLNRRAVRRETLRQEALREEEARKAAETLARHQAVVSEQRRIMMELHDDLGGTLGDLFFKLDGYLLEHESGLAVQPDFEHLKSTSGKAIKKLREVMKNNVAKPLSLPAFARKLTDMARQAALDGKLKWTLERDKTFPELELSSQQVHNALLVVKEALQNIRKHARAESFALHLHLEPEGAKAFTITITDDGVGMPEQPANEREDGTGNGLSNMQRRATNLSGRLNISTPASGGTSLQLRFPVNSQLEIGAE